MLDWIDIGFHCAIAFICALFGWTAAVVICGALIWREAEQVRWKHGTSLIESFNVLNWSMQKRLEGFLPVPFAILGGVL